MPYYRLHYLRVNTCRFLNKADLPRGQSVGGQLSAAQNQYNRPPTHKGRNTPDLAHPRPSARLRVVRSKRSITIFIALLSLQGFVNIDKGFWQFVKEGKPTCVKDKNIEFI